MVGCSVWATLAHHQVSLSNCLGTCGFIYLDWENIITGKQPRFCKCALNVQGVVCVFVYTSTHVIISFIAWLCQFHQPSAAGVKSHSPDQLYIWQLYFGSYVTGLEPMRDTSNIHVMKSEVTSYNIRTNSVQSFELQ